MCARILQCSNHWQNQCLSGAFLQMNSASKHNLGETVTCTSSGTVCTHRTGSDWSSDLHSWQNDWDYTSEPSGLCLRQLELWLWKGSNQDLAATTPSCQEVVQICSTSTVSPKISLPWWEVRCFLPNLLFLSFSQTFWIKAALHFSSPFSLGRQLISDSDTGFS